MCIVVVSLTIGCCVAAAADDKRGMTIIFGSGNLTVTGLQARHEVIAFGIGIDSHGHSALLRREVETASDDDGNGIVTIEVRAMPHRSVWVVVDTNSGEFVIATPSGEAPGSLNLSVDAWRANKPHVDIGRKYAEVLVVRPGGGAWTLRTADGGSNDFDGLSDRKIRLRLEQMQKLIGRDNGPPHSIPRDLIVMIDPQTLDTFVSEAR